MRESRNKTLSKRVNEINIPDSRKYSRVKDKKNTTVSGKKNGRGDSRIVIQSSACGMLPTGASCSSPPKSDYSEESSTDHSGSSNAGTNSSGHAATRTSVPSSNKKHSSGGMKFYPGLRLEAKDLGNDVWYAVKVVEVDQEEDEILIHFEKWSQRYDEWIPMDSSRLRPIQEPPGGFTKKSVKVFKSGDNVMATWSDSRKYPAKVKTVLGNDRYEVLFYDGFTKNLKGGRMSRLSEEELAKIEQLKPGIGPSNDVSINSAPSSFAAMKNPGGVLETTLGTKEERRERKRKLNVAELFHFKKRRRVNNPPVRTSVGIAKNTTECLFSNNRGTKKPSPISEEMSSVNESKSSKIAISKGNISDDTEETSTNRSETNIEFAGSKKRESTIKSSDCSEKNRKRSKYDGSQGVNKKDCKVPIAKNVKRRFNKFEGGRKSYSLTASASKDGAEGSQKGEEGNGASESVMKPQEEWVPIGEPAYVVDGTGGPRKSIVVDDPRVPSGWSRHFIQRMSGHSAGKWDVFFVCPQGRKFRTRHELRSYFEDRGEDFPSEQFDFSLGRRKNKSIFTERNVSILEDLVPNKSSQQARSSHPHLLAPTVKGISTETPVRRVKTLLPRVRASDSTSIMPSSDDTFDEQSNASDMAVVFGDLKIEKENDAFKCPKEGCCKNFRKESLLQMHMKHYHPEYNRFVASTPNVADLAYARTIGEPIEDLHPRAPRPLLQKISRFEAIRRSHVTSPSGVASPPNSSYSSPHQGSLLHGSHSVTSDSPGLLSPAGHSNTAECHTTPTSVRSMDSSNMGLGDDLESISHNSPLSISSMNTDVPKRTIRTLMPVTRTSVSETCNADGSDDGGEMVDVTDITPGSKLSLTAEQDLGHADSKGMKRSQSPPSMLSYVSMGHTKSLRVVRRRHMSDFHMEPVMKKRKLTESEVDSGQVCVVAGSTNRHTKVETLKKEELVNCTCGYPEEDGLMIQCDLCMCWQHGLCNNIEHEDEVPEKYVCVICQHPSRERRSKHFLHDQDWLKEGRLPSLSFRSKNDSEINQRHTILKRSNELVGTLLQLHQVIHSLRVKVNIVEKPDHPKLYLWNQSWEKDSMYNHPCKIADSTRSGTGSQLPLDEDCQEGRHSKESTLNLNRVEKSSRSLSHVQLSIDGSSGHDVKGESTECLPSNLKGETSGKWSVRESTHLMADDSDTKDTYFSQDSLPSAKGENVSPDLHQTKANTNDIAPHLSDSVIFGDTINVGNETEVATGADVTEHDKVKSTAKETEEVELKKQENEDHLRDKIEESSVNVPETSVNSDTEDKDTQTKRDIGSEDDNDVQLPFCQKDLMHLATSMASKINPFGVSEENQSNVSTQQGVPQPEAPIVPQECRLTLLDHIEAFHEQLESRLTSLETQIAGLESMEPYLAHDESTNNETNETVLMLLRDLSLLSNVASLN